MRNPHTRNQPRTGPKPETLYLLQNIGAGYIGNSPVFWAESGRYSQWIEEAKLWTLQEARDQIRSTKGSHNWKAWRLDIILHHARSTVDIQDLRKRFDDEITQEEIDQSAADYRDAARIQ